MEGSSANLRSQSDCQIDVNKKSWLSQFSPRCLLKVDPKGASRHQNLPIAACNLKADTYLTLLLGRDDDWVSSNGVLRDWWRISCPNTKIISWLITPDWGKRLLEANKDIRDFPFHCIECVCNQLRCRTWCTLLSALWISEELLKKSTPWVARSWVCILWKARVQEQSWNLIPPYLSSIRELGKGRMAYQ